MNEYEWKVTIYNQLWLLFRRKKAFRFWRKIFTDSDLFHKYKSVILEVCYLVPCFPETTKLYSTVRPNWLVFLELKILSLPAWRAPCWWTDSKKWKTPWKQVGDILSTDSYTELAVLIDGNSLVGEVQCWNEIALITLFSSKKVDWDQFYV